MVDDDAPLTELKTMQFDDVGFPSFPRSLESKVLRVPCSGG